MHFSSQEFLDFEMHFSLCYYDQHSKSGGRNSWISSYTRFHCNCFSYAMTRKEWWGIGSNKYASCKTSTHIFTERCSNENEKILYWWFWTFVLSAMFLNILAQPFVLSYSKLEIQMSFVNDSFMTGLESSACFPLSTKIH